jgi:hypothetical protein
MILEMKFGSFLACGLSSLQTETRWTFWSSFSSLGTNLAEKLLLFKLFAKRCWTVPYDSPTISETSWIVCLRSARMASRTFAMFSGVVFVDVRLERLSSSTDVRPSLKRLYYKKGLLCFMALYPKPSCSIRWICAAVFFRLKQNLIQILCSIKSVISVVKEITGLLKQNLTKTYWT